MICSTRTLFWFAAPLIFAASSVLAQNAGRYVAAPPPAAAVSATGSGNIEGFVYWDTRAVTHNPAGACNGFSVAATAGGRALAGQFGAKYVGQVKSFLSSGTVVAYDVCTYAYDHVPENTPLTVQLAITQPSAFTGNVAAAYPLAGPVTIINGQCNMLPAATPTAGDLTARPGSCQNMAFDVNFQVVPATGTSRAVTMPPRTGAVLSPGAARPANSGPLLTNGAQPTLLGNGAHAHTTAQPMVTGGTSPSPGGLTTLGRSNTLPAPVTSASAPPVPVPSKAAGRSQYEAITTQRGVTQDPVFSKFASGAGTGGTGAGTTNGRNNADDLNPQPYPPKGSIAVGGTTAPAAMPMSSVTLTGGSTAARLSLPPNLQVFTVGEATNPAALKLVPRGPQFTPKGGGMLGPGQTMSATAAGTGMLGAAGAPHTVAMTPAGAGPAAMQPGVNGGSRGVLTANVARAACMSSGIAAVNRARFIQFTPGTHYVITGCGFGSAPGRVYLTGAFSAHNGRIDLGPYWQYPATRTWTGHWSDQVIDAQLDEALSGELDQDNVILVVETSTGQQIQMNNVSFRAQRAEFMLGSIPLSALGTDPHNTFGVAVSPCTSSWVTGHCTIDVLRQIGAKVNSNPPDVYTIRLKSGFVLSRATLLVMDQNKVTSWTTPQISNGNQIAVDWQWSTYQSLSYSLYGLQIYVVGPLGVTNAWVGQ